MAYSGHGISREANPISSIGNFPVIDTPFSRLTEHWFTFQSSNCKEMELDWARCAARCGIERSRSECSKYFEDLNECSLRAKHVSIQY